MDNKVIYYAGQPAMIGIWEFMWRKIANRLDDAKEDVYECGLVWTDEGERKLQEADLHWDTLAGLLDEAEQLQQNVRSISNPMKWKFNMVKK